MPCDGNLALTLTGECFSVVSPPSDSALPVIVEPLKPFVGYLRRRNLLICARMPSTKTNALRTKHISQAKSGRYVDARGSCEPLCITGACSAWPQEGAIYGSAGERGKNKQGNFRNEMKYQETHELPRPLTRAIATARFSAGWSIIPGTHCKGV